MNFLQKIYKKSKEQKGFTLVEMIVVLVIIAILAAITIPALLKYIDKAGEKQIVIDARTAYLAAETAISEAYGANELPTQTNIVFGTHSSVSSETGNDKKFQDNAKELTGLTSNYKCTVGLTDDKKAIKNIKFEEKGKIATMNVTDNSSWTVSGGGIS